jgi:hypothetical protein
VRWPWCDGLGGHAQRAAAASGVWAAGALLCAPLRSSAALSSGPGPKAGPLTATQAKLGGRAAGRARGWAGERLGGWAVAPPGLRRRLGDGWSMLGCSENMATMLLSTVLSLVRSVPREG